MNIFFNPKRKKWSVVLLLITLMAAETAIMTGCSANQKNNEETPELTVAPTLTEDPPETTATPLATPEQSEQSDTIDGEELNAMLPILDTVVYWNVLEPETQETGVRKYEPEDPDYVWSLIYLVIINHADVGSNGVEYTEDLSHKQVPAALVQEYAAALFADMESLPDLSAGEGVQYDEASDTYLFGMSDRGEGATMIEDYTKDSDGSYVIDLVFEASYPSDWEPFRCSIRIVRNTALASGEKPLFAYAVKELVS